MHNIEKLNTILSSEFERDLLKAAIANYEDVDNKLRYNNFAYSIRELSRHFLYSLAPNEHVELCSWYKIETSNGRPSRTQRAKYAITGGLTNDILEAWGFDVKELSLTILSLKKTIETLSKYTHINHDTFNLENNQIEILSMDVFKTFGNFVKTITFYREKLRGFLEDHVEEHLRGSIVSNFFENVDRLAPHHSVDYLEVSEYHVTEINEEHIVAEVYGELYVILEYGSRKERREGDGLDIKKNFSFKTRIKYEISENFPSDKCEVEEYDVDTSFWDE